MTKECKACKFCGQSIHLNAIKLHESNCKKNPENNFTEEPQIFDKTKRYLNSQKLLLECEQCHTLVEIGYAHLKNKFLKNNQKVFCRSCTQLNNYKDESWKRSRLERIKQTNRERYGTDFLFQSEEFRIKSKETFQKNHNENFFKDHAKKIWKDMTPKKLQERNEKTNQTKIEKYGSLKAATKRMRESFEKTCFKRYGCLPVQLAWVKQKVKKTWKKKSKEEKSSILSKRQNTLIERTGYSHALQNPKSKVLFKETCLSRFGTENPNQCEEVRSKIEQTNLQKRGYKQVFQDPVVKEKIKETLLEKYGVENAYTISFQKGTHKSSTWVAYEGICFDSKAEVVFYMDCVERGKSVKRQTEKIPYEFNNKIHYYFPDFEVDGELYEIKGPQFLQEDGTWKNPYGEDFGKTEAKHQCAIRNNVHIIYVDHVFRKQYEKYYRLLDEYLKETPIL